MPRANGAEREANQHEARKQLWRLALRRGWVTETEVMSAVAGDADGRAQLLLALRLAGVEYRLEEKEEAHAAE